MSVVTAASVYLSQTSNAILSASPCTFAAWIQLASGQLGVQGSIMIIQQSASTNNLFWLQTTTANLLGAQVNVGGSLVGAVATDGGTAMTSGVWYHAAAVFGGGSGNTTSRTAYRNGVAGTTDSTSHSDPVSLGASYIGHSTSRNFVGTIAFPAIWNAALSATDISSLSAGVHPFLVQPSHLVACLDVNGAISSAEPDRVSATTWNITGEVLGVNPRMYFRS